MAGKEGWHKRKTTSEKSYRYTPGDKVYWGKEPYPYLILGYYVTDTLEKRYWITQDGRSRMCVHEKNLYSKEKFIEQCKQTIERSRKSFEKIKSKYEAFIKIAEEGLDRSIYLVDCSNDTIENYNNNK